VRPAVEPRGAVALPFRHRPSPAPPGLLHALWLGAVASPPQPGPTDVR